MNIGIYQSYWGVGGGQRYIGVVADVLTREHRVELVHHCPDFDPSRISEPMDLDLLSQVEKVLAPIKDKTWLSGHAENN